MAFCPSCGAEVAGAFCGKCGSAVSGAAPSGGAAGYSAQAAPSVAGMADNVAGMLCYLVGFITGILFLVLEPYNKKPAIRFHAFQSIFLSAGIFAFQILFGIVIGILTRILGLFGLFGLFGLVFPLIWIALWIYLLVSTYQGNTVVLPIIGPLAQQQAAK